MAELVDAGGYRVDMVNLKPPHDVVGGVEDYGLCRFESCSSHQVWRYV